MMRTKDIPIEVLKNEDEMFEFLLERNPSLERAPDPYSYYDCYTRKSIIELKARKKWYKFKMIEEMKYANLLHSCAETKRRPYYCVADEKGIWIFDLLKDDEEPIWEMREMSKTTQFGNTDKVMKKVGYLNEDNAIWKYVY